jgi:hypothetical protein
VPAHLDEVSEHIIVYQTMYDGGEISKAQRLFVAASWKITVRTIVSVATAPRASALDGGLGL